MLVRERSARLIAATLAGILRHLHRDRRGAATGPLPPPGRDQGNIITGPLVAQARCVPRPLIGARQAATC